MGLGEGGEKTSIIVLIRQLGYISKTCPNLSNFHCVHFHVISSSSDLFTHSVHKVPDRPVTRCEET